MNNSEGKKFTKTVSGLTAGQTINYACKFAFSGGLAVTKYLSYKVGDNCVLGIDDHLLSQSLNLYPNPVKNILNIDSKEFKLTKIEIYSVIGKKMKQFTSNLHKVNVDDLSSGLYLIKVISDKGSYTTKFIKE